MQHALYHGVRGIIEETNYAFSYCRGSLNIDYAEFAALSLRDFKSALKKPNLTSAELISMLRDGACAFKENDPNGCWVSYLAHYMEHGRATAQ